MKKLELIDAAFAVEGLTAVERVVLVGLVKHDGAGGCWPSIETLARYAGKSPRTTQRAIDTLAARCCIEVHRNAGGTETTRSDRRPNLYVLRLDGVTPSSPRDDDGVTHTTPREPNGVTPMTERGDMGVTNGVTPMSPEPVHEPVHEPPHDSQHATTPGSTESARGESRIGSSCRESEFVAELVSYEWDHGYREGWEQRPAFVRAKLDEFSKGSSRDRICRALTRPDVDRHALFEFVMARRPLPPDPSERECSTCDGTGYVEVDDPTLRPGSTASAPCATCANTGKVRAA